MAATSCKVSVRSPEGQYPRRADEYYAAGNMHAGFICVISANTRGNACPSNANVRRYGEREEETGTAAALTCIRLYVRPRVRARRGCTCGRAS